MKKKRDDIDRLAERLWTIGGNAVHKADSSFANHQRWKDAPGFIREGWLAVAREVTRMEEEAGK